MKLETFAVQCKVCGEVLAVVRSEGGAPGPGSHIVGTGSDAKEHADSVALRMPEDPPEDVTGAERLAWAASLIKGGRVLEL